MNEKLQEDIGRLQDIEGVGREKAEQLIDHFGSLYGVWRSAASYWAELTRVKGFGAYTAKNFFDRMRAAGIEKDEVDTTEQIRRMNETSGGWAAHPVGDN